MNSVFLSNRGGSWGAVIDSTGVGGCRCRTRLAHRRLVLSEGTMTVGEGVDAFDIVVDHGGSVMTGVFVDQLFAFWGRRRQRNVIQIAIHHGNNVRTSFISSSGTTRLEIGPPITRLF